MTRNWAIIRDRIIPLFVFPALIVLANHFIFGHLYKSGLAASLASACDPNGSASQPYRLSYTGVHAADTMLCPLVSFFQTVFHEPDTVSALTYFVGISAPLVAIPSIESCRSGRSVFIAFPVIFGLLSQTLTIGVTFPIYWLVFILSGAPTTGLRNPKDAHITQAHAEAIVFGLLVGAIVPSVSMLVLSDPQVTAIWQPYPAYVSIGQLIHLAFRPASKHPESGYKTIRFLYVSTFVLCAFTHVATIWPLITDPSAISRLYLPSISIPGHSSSLSSRVLHFLQWDLAFGFSSSIIATFWFMNNIKETVALATWNVIAVPTLGPGAALVGTAFWRESSLNSRIIESKVKMG